MQCYLCEPSFRNIWKVLDYWPSICIQNFPTVKCPCNRSK